MKQNVNPAVFISILAVVVVVAGFFLWKSSQGINPGPGKLQSDLKLDDAAKAAQNDPDKFSKAVQDSLNKNKATQGN